MAGPASRAPGALALALGLLALVCGGAALADRPARPDDCNGNGIADSTDIAQGVADDLDRDGSIDDCASPIRLDTMRPGDLFRPGSHDRRVQHLFVRYRYGEAIEVLYATRGGATLVKTAIVSRAGKTLRSTSRIEGPGVHRLLVTTAGLGPAFAAQGEGTVQLQVGQRAYVMPIAWNWNE